MESIQRRLIALCLMLTVVVVSLPAAADDMMDDQINTRPTMLAMLGDALLARPMLLGITAVGTVVFVVTLPFSALGGAMKESAQTLVVAPARSTFMRCLGCTAIQDEWKNKRTAAEGQQLPDPAQQNQQQDQQQEDQQQQSQAQ
jgi:hypothetical protein